jgi:hypothetical protein
MTTFRTTSDWSKGANNLSPKDRLPEGFVRHAVNLDPLPGGRLALRAGYEQIYAGTAVRGVLALGRKLLVADGTSLVEVDSDTGASRVLRTIAGAGSFSGDVLNDTLYFSTANECLEYDGLNVRVWGVADVLNQPAIAATAPGGLIAGYYQVAMTFTDADGREGGTDRPAVIAVTANGAITVTVASIPTGHTANIYVGSVNGETLYLQGVLETAGAFNVGLVDDSTARCNTVLMRAPSPGQIVVAHNSQLVVATNNVAAMTVPMRPHLVNRVRGFVQYGADIGAMVSAGALFISADKCYSLTNVETDGITQNVVLEFPAYSGTAVQLPDGRGAWMTRYGQAITDGNSARLVNREAFAPVDAASGASGVLDHNGNQLVVTTLQGKDRPNPLAASDFFIGEILNP